MKPITDDELSQLKQLSDDIAALGEQIAEKKREADAIVLGTIATTRQGHRFKIERTHADQGGRGMTLWLTGPRLNKDGTPAIRMRENLPLILLTAIERPE